MEECLNRGWYPILPGSGGMGRGCPSQSAIRPWHWDFHTVLSGVDPGELGFRARGVGVVGIGRIMNREWRLIIHGWGGTGGGCPEAQSPPPAHRPVIAEVGQGGDPRPMRLGLGTRRDESHICLLYYYMSTVLLYLHRVAAANKVETSTIFAYHTSRRAAKPITVGTFEPRLSSEN